MSVKAFKYYTIQAAGTPQPVIGTHLTAAVTSPQAIAATLTGGNLQQITLTVADSSMFVGAQYANIIDPGTFATERTLVIGAPTTTTVIVQGLQNAHPGGAYGTGSWVAVGDHSQNLYIQALDGNSGALYIGTSPQMVKATGVFVILKIQAVNAGVQPFDFSTSRQGLADTEPTSQYWIDGSTGDSYLPSLGLV